MVIDPDPIPLIGLAFVAFCRTAQEVGAVVSSADTRHPGEYLVSYYVPGDMEAQRRVVAQKRMEEYREAG